MLENLIGKRIKLVSTNDPYTNLKPGDVGNVIDVSTIDMANLSPRPFTQIWVKWDNGSGLALIYGEDKFEVV